MQARRLILVKWSSVVVGPWLSNSMIRNAEFRAQSDRKIKPLPFLASVARTRESRGVKTSLDHLPEGKRQELARIVEILFAEFEDALKGRNAPHRKAGRILKIILFGSYSRGDWVDDRVGGYASDYDLLVVVNHDELADTLEYWAKADDHLLREYQIAKRLTAPAHFIVHSLSDVNKQLKKGRPFFVDIVRDGIALYEAPDHPFEHSVTLSAEEARKEAQGYFEEWFESAKAFERGSQFYVSEGRTRRKLLSHSTKPPSVTTTASLSC